MWRLNFQPMADVSTSYRYIVRTPGVRGGNARVENTRIGVHDVVAYHLLGNDVETIREAFPDLSRAQITSALPTTKTTALRSSASRSHRSSSRRSEVFSRPRRQRRRCGCSSPAWPRSDRAARCSPARRARFPSLRGCSGDRVRDDHVQPK